MIKVHYHRYDADYEHVGLWTWSATAPARELRPVDSDSFGPVFQIEPADFGGAERIGMLPRLRNSWAGKDGPDRFWSPEMGEEIWLVTERAEVFTSPPDVTPRVDAAFLESARRITIRLTHATPLGKLVPHAFFIRDDQGTEFAVAGVRALNPAHGCARRIELTTTDKLDLHHPTQIGFEEYKPALIAPRYADTDANALEYEGALGAVYTPDRTTFRLFSPTARAVSVILHDSPEAFAGRRAFTMDAIGSGVWEAVVHGDLEGSGYAFAPVFSGGNHTAAVDFQATNTVGSHRAARVTNLRACDPDGFRPIIRPGEFRSAVDAVIYEVSVRDFTVHPSSGVAAEWRGKFLGMAERGTHFMGLELKTGLDHLADLGVTHIQLLPICDFDNDEDEPEYNWGYMTADFFSPEGWYATDHRNASRVSEFKTLVKAIHDAGMRVIMDVVFNHSGAQATFEKLAPGYFHRMRADGTFWNGSGTGNELRSESHMGRKLIRDICKFWVDEYGVDGFRVDLMGLVDIDTLVAVRDDLRAIDPSLLFYGEPWAATGPDGAGLKHIVYKDVAAGTGIGCFNDSFRDALKGKPDNADPGYIHTGAHVEGVKRGLMGSINDWASEPCEAIQYADCHDNLILWDKTTKVLPLTNEHTCVRIQMLAVGILAVSQGAMFLHGGVEIGRTKHGNHNSYDAGDQINQFDWEYRRRHADLYIYTRTMIALRRAHPLFRLDSRAEVSARVRFLDRLAPETACIAMSIDGRGIAGEAWSDALVLINPLTHDLEFALPEGQWDVHVQGVRTSVDPIFHTHGMLWVPARGMAMLGRVGVE